MQVFAKTDIGKAREMNQDYFYVPANAKDINLYILADGMGGYNGGEIASSLAVKSVKSYIDSNFFKIEKSEKYILKLVADAIEYANMVVFEESKKLKELEGMGTTLEVALVFENQLYIGHVGDSRIYKIRNGKILRITQDHSYVEKLINDGTITREEAINHPKKNMLTKAVGCTAFVEPDVGSDNLQDGDILILTSDGLTNMVSDAEILNEVCKDYQMAADKLIKTANDFGGYDNITIIVIKNDNGGIF